MEAVWDWFGPQLKWTQNSAFGIVERFRRDDLLYVVQRAVDLDISTQGEAALFQARLVAFSLTEFAVWCHGGARPNHGSPWQMRFDSSIVDVLEQGVRTVNVLRLTVPTTWPVDDFFQRCLSIASALRLRWASAGLSYSGWEPVWGNDHRQAVYAHARRHPGYDVDVYVPLMVPLHDALRSVNWLTMLGPELASKVDLSTPAPGDAGVLNTGPLTILRTGRVPVEGDTNRRQIDAGYMWADRVVRPVRLRDDVTFGYPWDDTTTEQWLRRFNKRQ